MKLTDDQRRLFIQWLRAEHDGNKALAEQAMKMPPPAGPTMAKRLLTEAMACEILLRRLDRFVDTVEIVSLVGDALKEPDHDS